MVNPLACDPACFLPGVVPGFETGVVLAKVRPKPNSRCPSQPKVAKAAGCCAPPFEEGRALLSKRNIIKAKAVNGRCTTGNNLLLGCLIQRQPRLLGRPVESACFIFRRVQHCHQWIRPLERLDRQGESKRKEDSELVSRFHYPTPPPGKPNHLARNTTGTYRHSHRFNKVCMTGFPPGTK